MLVTSVGWQSGSLYLNAKGRNHKFVFNFLWLRGTFAPLIPRSFPSIYRERRNEYLERYKLHTRLTAQLHVTRASSFSNCCTTLTRT